MTPQPQGWEEEFEELMPKTSGETMNYGQFCAVRDLVRELLAQKESEKKALYEEMMRVVYDADFDTITAIAEKHGITTNEQ